MATYPFLAALSNAEQLQLRAVVTQFLANKEFTGAGGLVLSDRICLEIAVQGCLPILNLGLDTYHGWHGIIVYPDEFLIPRETLDEDGILHTYDEVAAGEAWSDGPLILSWSDVAMAKEGYNVVIHEFAHKIDMQDGQANGCPPMPNRVQAERWQQTLRACYEDFFARVDGAPLFEDAANELDVQLDSVIDPYGASHPAEFFAVVSEAFFTAPHDLHHEYPALYALLTEFYRQNPLTRIRAPTV